MVYTYSINFEELWNTSSEQAINLWQQVLDCFDQVLRYQMDALDEPVVESVRILEHLQASELPVFRYWRWRFIEYRFLRLDIFSKPIHEVLFLKRAFYCLPRLDPRVLPS